MNLSETRFLAKPFSHIYIEDDAYSYPLTGKILSYFPDSVRIGIKHYKDIFNRPGQDFIAQKYSKALILAVNKGELIYPGARMCQDFGNDNFYYSSGIMNCIYDCEYCYLQGMYPSGNIVVYVNYEDYFLKAEELLKESGMYLCISYDTDLLALESITGLAGRWIRFTESHPSLSVEIRTKSAYDVTMFNDCSDRVIFAWTLSPEYIISEYEHMTPSLISRIDAVNNAINSGFRTRLCFDPMIYIPDYKTVYGEFYNKVFSMINPDRISDISLGLFRISASYIKSMRKKRRNAITMYPYTNLDNICCYDDKKSGEMLNFARHELLRYISEERIFIS